MNLHKIAQPFIAKFPGDVSYNPYQRQTPNLLYALVKPVGFANSELIYFNEKLSIEIGLGKIENQQDIDFLNSKNIPDGFKTYSTVYAGHQFGNWAGQLGDGRAIFAGEIINEKNKKTELQWKGAGATPYSRSADGRAVLRSTLREFLMSEAMYFLGVPTTRALSISFSGEDVLRDVLYNGNPQLEKGAVMMRTAESFLRFGHFECLSAQKKIDLLKDLADDTIESYFPEVKSEGTQKYLDWFRAISERTAKLMAEWFRVGFVHGVMNTDNMSVLGLTIDYGPFAMLEEYDLNFTPNTTDLPGRRYAFGAQGKISQWNLWQLANAVFPLINDAEALQGVLADYENIFWKYHDEMLCRKFGFDVLKEDDTDFFVSWQKLMQNLQIDHTFFFTELEVWRESDFQKFYIEEISYKEISEEEKIALQDFLNQYKKRLMFNQISVQKSLELMKENNPKFILRNYLLYECIEEMNVGKKDLFYKLLEALRNPYQNISPELNKIRPAKYNDIAGCSMLSCSS
ncbi:MAG: YdiU family protein [Cruoricaptor ignavus]|nr:YdiU family protein [Cruoricaptor ignavus]